MNERLSDIEKEGNWGTKTFLEIVKKNIAYAKNWRMQIQILGPANDVGDRDYEIGNITINPLDNLYYVSYKSSETEDLEPAWSIKIDSEGNYYDPQDTTPEGFEEGVKQLIDPRSFVDDPRFKTRIYKASSTEGSFEMPDVPEFRLTLINRDIHIGVVKINSGPDKNT